MFRHGANCNSRTYKTRCKFCGSSVYYFTCDCGSRVLFDELGQPWPIHRCAESRQGWLKLDLGTAIIPIDEFYGRPKNTPEQPQQTVFGFGKIGNYISDEMRERLTNLIDESIDREYVQIVRDELETGQPTSIKASWIERMDPYHNLQTTEDGVIRELIFDANVLKKANIIEGTLGVNMLGKYANTKLVQITIHTGAIAEDPEENSSFTFFVEESVVKKHGLIKGDFVTVRLRGIVISKDHPIWVCEQLTSLFDS